jgi:hypothetical protein
MYTEFRIIIAGLSNYQLLRKALHNGVRLVTHVKRKKNSLPERKCIERVNKIRKLRCICWTLTLISHVTSKAESRVRTITGRVLSTPFPGNHNLHTTPRDTYDLCFTSFTFNLHKSTIWTFAINKLLPWIHFPCFLMGIRRRPRSLSTHAKHWSSWTPMTK